MHLSVGARLGPYEILSVLGAGGMGEVYRARDTTLDRDVAIKVLPEPFAGDPERLKRFEREAKTLAAFNHSNIAQVYGVIEQPPALVMELADGEDLTARIARGPIVLDEAMPIARQIAEGLEAAHERGIIHRDLKPANIKVREDGTVKILDFGLAKATDPVAAGPHQAMPSPTFTSPQMTEMGVILGTAAYMAPEQARGKAVDKRADIWAFGAVFYEMLTGTRLFEGETLSDLMAATLRQDIDWSALPPATPSYLLQLLQRCLERDPHKRLRDIGEARISLGATPPDETPVTINGPSLWRVTRVLPWALAAMAIAVAAWALWQTRQSDRVLRDVVNLDIVFPPDVEPVAGRQGGIAISPDGKSVAMVGVRNGQRRLFVRRLDAAEAVDLAGTSGGGTFSPDGRSVAFISNATLLTRISLTDGQLRTITSGGDFVSGVSLAWGQTHVFFIRGGSLWRAPAEGGEPRQLTSLDTLQGEVLHADPLPLPGGRFLLFTRLTAAQGAPRIESIPSDGGARSVVVEGGTTPVWSPTGHLLFGRDGGVWAVPFDPGTATTSGAAVQIIPPGIVGTVRTGSLGFQLSATGTLAYVPANFDSKRLVSVGRDGSELPLGLPPGSYGTPRISLDGRRIAIERDGSVVDLIDLVRGTRAVIAPAAVGTNFPTWTADGTKVVVRRYNVPFWVSADGGGKAAAVPHADANTSPGSPGPDADSFMAIRLLPETAGDIYLLSISGAFPPKPLVATAAYEGSPHLSPDKHWLIYQSNASGQPEIYVRRYPELDRAWPISEGGGVQARWHPSGREIFFRGNHQIVSVAFDGTAAEPLLGKPTPLFADVYDFGQGLSVPNYDVTPEGRFLMLRRGAQGGTMRVVVNWIEELKRSLAKAGAQ